MSETKTLRCGIVGAGIGGLGAAIALRRAGHDVEIFERSSFKNEIGAAITLTPNANLVLERWGFDAEKAGETDKCQYRCLRWDNLEMDNHDCFDGVRAKYGYMFNAFHRVDLHNGLRELAERHHSVPIRLGCEVCHVDCEAGIISLTDGAHVQKDLIVVANGDKVSFAVHPLVLCPLPR
jgi:salicylate hydroxylase